MGVLLLIYKLCMKGVKGSNDIKIFLFNLIQINWTILGIIMYNQAVHGKIIFNTRVESMELTVMNKNKDVKL